MIKTKKNSGVNFNLIKIILTIAVGLVCFYQFKKINFNNLSTITLSNYSSFFLAIILVIPNYLLEYIKWDLIIKSTKQTVSKAIKIQSFFAGIITGMLTPNMQGNFIGRIYYFPRKVRLPITLLTLTSNLGQFCVTIVLGVMALFLTNTGTQTYWYLPFGVFVFAMIVYFSFERISYFKKQFKWYRRLEDTIRDNGWLRWQILGLSFLRNIVFSIQFLLALHAFGADLNWKTYWLIWELYLWTTLSPSLIFGKLFVRESLALWVFAVLHLEEWNILAASFFIWIINLLVPTLAGLFICKKKNK